MRPAVCGAFLLVLTTALHAAEFRGAVPFVAGDGTGGFALSYIDGDSFRFVTVRGGRMSEPREIAKGKLLVNRADFPSIAMQGKTMVAQWLTRNQHGTVVHVARSTDGGKTWSAARTPHPNLVSEFGFVSLSASGDVIWLDGRTLKGGVEGQGDMQLRHASLPFSKQDALDVCVCDCCQTAMAMTSAGPVVAYRDRSDGEIRDISIVRKTAAGWTKPKTLHADGWNIKGCPVNGPQLDARGRRVVAAWFTAPNNEPRVYAAFSNDAGATFSKPVRIDAAKTAGRVDVALLADGSAAVSWVEQRGEKSILLVRRVTTESRLGDPVEIGEARGFPRLAVSGENVGVAWASGNDRVHFKTIKLP